MTGTWLIGLLGTVNKVMLMKVSVQCPQSAVPTVRSSPSHGQVGGLCVCSCFSGGCINVLSSRQPVRGSFFHRSYPFSRTSILAGLLKGNWTEVCWTFEAGAQGVQTWVSSQGRGTGLRVRRSGRGGGSSLQPRGQGANRRAIRVDLPPRVWPAEPLKGIPGLEVQRPWGASCPQGTL